MILPPPIRNSLRNSKLIRFLYYNVHLADLPVYLGLGSFDKETVSAIRIFLSKDDQDDPKMMKSLRQDIKNCFYRYKTTPLEYFLFGFRDKDAAERDTYLPDSMIMKWTADKRGRKIHDTQLNDKFNFYKINKRFFKREAILFDRSTTREDFRKYALRIGRIISKPNGAALGHGVEIFTVRNTHDADEVYSHLKSTDTDYILEEVIVQNDGMAQWNQSSVNTIRINSFLTNGRFNILCPFIRTGRKGSIVDNGGQGGIFASIDKDTGVICTDGMDEIGTVYLSHPDSKINYRGAQIPRWSDLLELAEETHRNMPEHIYISWDFALTDNGWVLIEGNWGEFVAQQMTMKRGYKREFLTLLNS